MIQSGEPTNEFLKNLLTTTPPSSHISDFRKQKRTDSRADKPDMFPGFDLQLDSTTPSQRKRRRQAYTKLIHLFLQNTKDRLETIRDVIKDESELHLRLIRPPFDETMTATMEQNAEIRFSDDENRQFIDFAFADANTSDETKETFENDHRTDMAATQTYLNSLFAAVGYSRITTTTTTPNPIELNETMQGNIIARYLINPLLNVWNSTRDRFNLYNDDNDDDDNNGSSSGSSSSATDGQTKTFHVDFFNNRDDITPKMHTNTVNKQPNENHADNFNYSLPLIQRTTDNVTTVMLTNETMTMTIKENANNVNVSQSVLDADDSIGENHNGNDKKSRNTSSSASVDDAANAFRNAFLKYSKYMQHPTTEYANFGTFNDKTQFTHDNSDSMKNGKLFDGKFFASDTNSSHIQGLAENPAKTNKTSKDSVNIGNHFDDSNKPVKSFAENASILILEMFGTMIGMTWRAVNGIPNYFHANSQR